MKTKMLFVSQTIGHKQNKAYSKESVWQDYTRILQKLLG